MPAFTLRFATCHLASVAVFWVGFHGPVLSGSSAAETETETELERTDDFDQAQGLLKQYCFDCHGDGADEGNIALDPFATTDQASHARDLWWKVLKNLRSGVMPPNGSEAPSESEKRVIYDWIQFGVFGLDPSQPDPGPLTVRRLNRVEYGNTMQDLMGVEVDVERLIPADDSGHGFDNVGDALAFSPLLMEKYLDVARTVVKQSVPSQTWVLPAHRFVGDDFQDLDGNAAPKVLDGKKHHELRRVVEIAEAGKYGFELNLEVDGSFDFDPARYVVKAYLDEEQLLNQEYGWEQDQPFRFGWTRQLQSGRHVIRFDLDPLASVKSESASRRSTSVKLKIVDAVLRGPVDGDRRVHPPGYETWFSRDSPPETKGGRRKYAAELLSEFAGRAYRRPAGQATVERLVDVAETAFRQPGASFESGIAQAMVAVLASPRFLFHLESAAAGTRTSGGDLSEEQSDDHAVQPIDDYGLASRLSYLLWSTMPDDELRLLADRGGVRQDLTGQLERMLSDSRSEAFFENFVGQWLRLRDVTHVSNDPLAVLGVQKEYTRLREHFRSSKRWRVSRDDLPEDEREQYDRYRELRTYYDRFGIGLKRAFQAETMRYVRYVMQEDRNLLELIDSDYAFLNETLARHYGIEGIKGDKLRRVDLDSKSPRGGVLTQGSVLLVTSNPTRTSPVKRGLFVLESFLGTPAPPAPPGVPELEAAETGIGDREPTLRELLSKHRESALCASCHARMDPIGLALENFNALGMWRDEESGQRIDPSGELITGESFADVRELKRVLVERRSNDFYRCLAEKLLTYATGRGILPSDEYSIDLIVRELQDNGGQFSALLRGVVSSAPFQSQRVVRKSRGRVEAAQ